MIDRRTKGYNDVTLTTTALATPFDYPYGDGSRHYSSKLPQRDYCPSW